MDEQPRYTITRERARESVRPGWHALVDEAFDLVESQGVAVIQVKEKFGQLRIYTSTADADFYSKIWAIEERSSTICEFCGAPSEIRNRGGWLKSICDACLEKPRV